MAHAHVTLTHLYLRETVLFICRSELKPTAVYPQLLNLISYLVACVVHTFYINVTEEVQMKSILKNVCVSLLNV